MRPSAEPRRSSVPLLTVGRPHLYAVPGASVVGVEALDEWHGDAPLDVLPLLGIAAAALDADGARVALLEVGERRLPLLVRGALTLIEPASSDVLALPAALQSVAPLVSHIAVVDGKPSFFVLSPARLADAHAAGSKASPLDSR